MSAYQKHALFNLIVAMAALLLFLTLIPFWGFSRAQSAFGLLGIIGFGPLFFRKGKGQIIADERDGQIHLRASQFSSAVTWLVFVGGVMGAYYYLGHFNHGIVGLDVLPSLVWFGTLVLLMSHAAATLILYRRS